MKKIVLTITAILLGLNASAQLSEDYMRFTVGEFVFRAYDTVHPYRAFTNIRENGTLESRHMKMGGGEFKITLENNIQAECLYTAIKVKVKDLEEKYNVTIKVLDLFEDDVMFEVYDVDTYNNYKIAEKQERERRANEKAQKENAFKGRLKSISEL